MSVWPKNTPSLSGNNTFTGDQNITGNVNATGLVDGLSGGANAVYLGWDPIAAGPGPAVALGAALDTLLGRKTGAGAVQIAGAGASLGLYGAAPVARAAALTQPAATAATNAAPFGFTTAAQADALVTAVRAIITALQNIGVTL